MTRHNVVLPLLVCILAVLAGCKTSSVEWTASSHSAEFWRELYGGRVFVLRQVYRQGDGGKRVEAVILHRDGKYEYCERPESAAATRVGTWAVHEHPVGGPIFWAHWNESIPVRISRFTLDGNPGRPRYDPTAGRITLHHTLARSAHIMSEEGWVQESWPRFAADACPQITPPDDLPVNAAQTSLWFDKVLAQDPAAPLKNFSIPSPLFRPVRGGELTRCDADGELRAELEKLTAVMQANDRRIMVGKRNGINFGLILDPAGDTIHAVGKDGKILNTGRLLIKHDCRWIITDWDIGFWSEWAKLRFDAPRRIWHRVGDPLPLEFTDRPYVPPAGVSS